MTTRYVGIGGNDSSDGLSWANRKLTLNGVEDTPVVAGDTVYVGPGTYREMLTCDVSGSSGSPITYIGDYTGANTDGTGGVVRITGSNDDQSGARGSCVIGTSIDYRTFRGFEFDSGFLDTHTVNIITGTNWIIDKCIHLRGGYRGIQVEGASSSITISNSYFQGGAYRTIEFTHTTEVDDSNVLIENCIINGPGGNNGRGISINRYGGVTIKNCYIFNATCSIYLDTNPSAGQVITVNNCFIESAQIGVRSSTLGFVVENYNQFLGNEENRVNVAVGANSVSYMLSLDTRWFFEMVNGGSMVTPFDLASYSELVGVAGTSPTTADMRGTSAINTNREWGALEYDSTLDIKAGSGGGISRARIIGGV